METKQPVWKRVANLGDVSLEHGQYWVDIDTTGVYTPEATMIVPTDDDGPYMVYRFGLDRCTFVDGILSDNPFHPEHPAWFAHPERERLTRPQDTTYLRNVSECCGTPVKDMVKLLCSADPIERAWVYREIGEYHGWDNFDAYPLTMTLDELREWAKDRTN
jgi:hypothetical protein